MEIDTLNIVLYTVGIFTLGFSLGVHMLARRIRQILTEANVPELENTTIPIPTLSTELVKDVILLYDARKNFLCQGSSIEEVVDNLFKYKNVKMGMIEHDGSNVWFIDGKIGKIEKLQ